MRIPKKHLRIAGPKANPKRPVRLKVVSSPAEECIYVTGATCYDQGPGLKKTQRLKHGWANYSLTILVRTNMFLEKLNHVDVVLFWSWNWCNYVGFFGKKRLPSRLSREWVVLKTSNCWNDWIQLLSPVPILVVNSIKVSRVDIHEASPIDSQQFWCNKNSKATDNIFNSWCEQFNCFLVMANVWCVIFFLDFSMAMPGERAYNYDPVLNGWDVHRRLTEDSGQETPGWENVGLNFPGLFGWLIYVRSNLEVYLGSWLSFDLSFLRSPKLSDFLSGLPFVGWIATSRLMAAYQWFRPMLPYFSTEQWQEACANFSQRSWFLKSHFFCVVKWVSPYTKFSQRSRLVKVQVGIQLENVVNHTSYKSTGKKKRGLRLQQMERVLWLVKPPDCCHGSQSKFIKIWHCIIGFSSVWRSVWTMEAE